MLLTGRSVWLATMPNELLLVTSDSFSSVLAIGYTARSRQADSDPPGLRGPILGLVDRDAAQVTRS